NTRLLMFSDQESASQKDKNNIMSCITSTDSVASDRSDETSDDGPDEVSEVECIINPKIQKVSQYVIENPESTNTQLFSMLALLSAYVPGSYLLESECQQILGPPDPIHGGPPFEERMKTFIDFISKSGPKCKIHQKLAPECVVLLNDLGISRSATARNLMSSLCGDQIEPHLIRFIKDLLTKREMGEKVKDKFSRLIEDIKKHEGFYKALSVLRTASDKFGLNPVFPEVVARLNYIARNPPHYGYAIKWANKAIERDPLNSYFADTLGQIHKHRLLKTEGFENIMNIADKAFEAFKDVERKAEEEESSKTATADTGSTSDTFNNRGLFGFLQVAKITFEKLSQQQRKSLIQNKKMEVEAKFEFFEWYLGFSRPDMKTLEPPFFWKDVAYCYKHYTTIPAAESTSFPGLLVCLDHGLFTSKERRAEFLEAEKTVSDLEEIRGVLKTTYEENVDDVKVAERYILSNIVLSNKMPDSPQLTSVRELKTIIQRFLGIERSHRSPGFYLLVLLLLWPEEKPPALQGDATQLPLDLMFDCDLQQYVTLMKKAFERAKYAKYLRGRHLLPLFFLGTGSGLSKWVHKSRLDAVVEEKVDVELAGVQQNKNTKKSVRIADMWIKGEVWQLPEIKKILLPVKPCQSPVRLQQQEEQEVFVCPGGRKIKTSIQRQLDAAVLRPPLFYLGFTIQAMSLKIIAF
uniref:Sterile alpha motif domain-containing protein 9-like n=1 Tax=Scophthalmus maximus TaxID=52904 RepID=A0A8D3E2M7_SCOMX